MMADLCSELPLPLSGDFCTVADLLVDLGGLWRLGHLLRDAGQQGLLAHEQGRLQFLPQQEVVFGLLHLRGQGKKVTIIENRYGLLLLEKTILLYYSQKQVTSGNSTTWEIAPVWFPSEGQQKCLSTLLSAP